MRYNGVAAAGLAVVMIGGGAIAVSAQETGVLTSLDLCNSLDISGLMLASSSNCLTISGEVEYSFTWGDYDADRPVINNLAFSGDYDYFIGSGSPDWESSVATELQVEATSQSDFGDVSGVIRLDGTSETVIENRLLDDTTNEVELGRAYLSIGNTTILMVGLKDSVADKGDDTAFTYQEMFNEDKASGVGYNATITGTRIADGGHVIQLKSELTDVFTGIVALEDLDGDGTLVGVVQFDTDSIEGHVTAVIGDILAGGNMDWAVHSGATLSIDDFRLRGALAFNNDGWWNVLATADVELDLFTLAAAAEFTSANEYGVAGSVSFEAADTVVINVGSRAFVEADRDYTIDTIVETEIELTEKITFTPGLGYVHESDTPNGLTYAQALLEWSPGDDLDIELEGRLNSRTGSPLGYEVAFTATKAFE